MTPIVHLAAVIGAALFAPAAGIVVPARTHVRLIPHAMDAPISGSVIARSVSDSSDIREIPIHGTEAEGSLPAGEWFVSARIEHTWSEPVLLRVANDDSSVELPVYPLARLKAKVHVPASQQSPQLRAYFQRVRSAAIDGPDDGDSACTIEDGQATCDLPAGVYDIGFRIPGDITVYRWDVHLDPHAELDAREMTFVPGSMLTGRVDSGRNKVDASKIDVILTPIVTPRANEELRHRVETARQIVHPNQRGFFSFIVSPGHFLVHAISGQLVSEERDVTIVQGQESILRSPLALTTRAALTIHVDPSHDPWSRPWNVIVSRTDAQGVVLSQRTVRTSPDGSCAVRDLAPSSYLIAVTRPPAGNWATESVDVDGDSSVTVHVALHTVTGAVSSGDDPLASSLIFRSFPSMVVVPVRTHADGTFAAWLPTVPNDTWDEIEIAAEKSHLQRTLKHVQPERRGDGAQFFDLSVASASISGRIVDENGNLAGPALVDVVSPDGGTQQIESLDGVFQSAGFEPGTYRLSAMTRDRQTSQETEVVLENRDSTSNDVELVISSSMHLRGTVVSTSGPVLGASVFVTSEGDDSHPLILQPVDPDGHFDVRLPPGTRDVVVAVSAPGFAFRMLHLVPGGNDVTLAVEQNGGVLGIDVAAHDGSLIPHIVHDGALLPAAAAGYLAGARFSANPAERLSYEIPSIEAGGYSICWLSEAAARSVAANGIPAGQCQSGFLSANGQLSLRR